MWFNDLTGMLEPGMLTSTRNYAQASLSVNTAVTADCSRRLGEEWGILRASCAAVLSATLLQPCPGSGCGADTAVSCKGS